MEKTWLGNIGVHTITKQAAITYIQKRLEKRVQTDIFFLNDHCFNLAQQDESYLRTINGSDLLLNDGIGIEIGAKMLGTQFPDNLNGTDFIPALFSATETPYRVYLLGAKPHIAEKAQTKLKEAFPHLQFVGEHHGYFDFHQSDEVINDINAKQTDILLVGFGMPLQEEWIKQHRDKLNSTVTMAVGAFIDFTSGEIKRAPAFIRKLRLEWLYRMLKEPRRLWKRNVVGHFLFFYYILKLKFNQKEKAKGEQ